MHMPAEWRLNAKSRSRKSEVMCGPQVAYRIAHMHMHNTVSFLPITTHFVSLDVRMDAMMACNSLISAIKAWAKMDLP